MLSPNKLLKFGRQNQIIEIVDKLQINNFYNESGQIQTTVHGKFSRIGFVIVDTKKGGKEKAQIGEFNFTPEEIKTLITLINSNGEVYKKNVKLYNTENGENLDYYKSLKLHHFKKDDKGQSPVFTFKLSYESEMRSSSKWKVAIETGKGIATCSEQRNGGKLYYVKEGTYVKQTIVSFYLTNLELVKMKKIILAHLECWEKYNYGNMLFYRENFIERLKANNYDESTINIWNNKYETSGCIESKDNNTHVNCCSRCGQKTSIGILEYTKKIFGEAICMKCKEEK